MGKLTKEKYREYLCAAIQELDKNRPNTGYYANKETVIKYIELLSTLTKRLYDLDNEKE